MTQTDETTQQTVTETNPTEPTGVDITEKQDGGVLKTIIKEGEGDERPLSGDNVYVHYVGTLLDGTKFDSSRDRGEKFDFEVGQGRVIKGWDLGVPTMRRGEVAKFIIRSDYGYGASGSPPTIPPNATLVFEIELFDFHGEDISENKDKSIIRRIITAGNGYQTPNDGARVIINLKGYDNTGRVFDERNNVEFEIGEGPNHNIIEGVEQAIQRLKKDEKSKVYIKSNRAWGQNGNTEFNIQPGADVIYEIELTSFEKAKESWQLNGQEKLEQSELYKNKGTELFKQGKYATAIKKYQRINDYLKNETYDLDTERETSEKLQLAANLNIAMCCLKTHEYKQAIDTCNRALELEQKNEKGLFRLAQAYFGLGEFSDAIKYFNQVLEVNPNNRDASNLINLSKQKIKEHQDKEKALYAKMVSALSK